MIAFFEGITLLILFGITMPLKHLIDWHLGSKVIGPIHGGLFILFGFSTLMVAIEQKWKWTTTLLALAASIVPFGTFYLDHKVLKPIHKSETES